MTTDNCLRCSAALFLCVLLSGCGGGNEPDQPRPEPIVVYADGAERDELAAVFAGFTELTGAYVTVREAEETELVDDIIANRGAPPADVLLTRSTAAIWRAAEEGALRPVLSGKIDAAVPARFRDADGLWTAIGVSTNVIVYNPELVEGKKLSAYNDLASPDLQDLVCMSSSSLASNRALIAFLIGELDVRPAEILVRGWMGNRRLMPFPSHADLLAAVADGRCGVGITPNNAAARSTPGLAVVTPDESYTNVHAIGVVRHAHSPELAVQFIEWFVSGAAQQAYADSTGVDTIDSAELQSISQKNVGLAGWRDRDAELLAERAGWR